MKYSVIIILLVVVASCISKKKLEIPVQTNYVDYYLRVYAIDSTYRLSKDTLQAIAKYNKLFQDYEPRHTDFINEYETYIVLADRKGKNFGGKESLNKLLPLIAPYWKYRKDDKELFALYQKYGIDSTSLVSKQQKWLWGLNKQLIDSFTIASVRDSELQRNDSKVQIRNDKKNAALLFWTIKNYGFPSLQKIGLFNTQGKFLKVGTMIHHVAGSVEFEEMRRKIFEYVKSGECNPIYFATMVDRDHQLRKQESEFGTESMFGVQPNYPYDTLLINQNRRKIGLPGIKYHRFIMQNQ